MENKEKTLIIRQFFSLLRAGLGKEPADCRLFSVGSTRTDWRQLYQISEAQTVVAIVWDGIMTLPPEFHPEKPLFYEWLSRVLSIEEKNRQMNQLLPEIINHLHTFNVPVALLKGQGTAALYPNPLHRQCGDIDLYTGVPDRFPAHHIHGAGFQPTGSVNRKHTEWIYKGMIVENHFCIEEFYYPLHKKAFTEAVAHWYPVGITHREIQGVSIPLPPSWFEALLGIAHFGKHLLCSGVGLRQLCDFAILFSTQQTTMEISKFRTGIKKLGLQELASAMATLSVTYLGFRKEEFEFDGMKSKKTHRRSELLLEDMLRVGNFGQYAQKGREGNRNGSTLNVLYSKGKRYIDFWCFYRIEALLLPLVRTWDRIKKKTIPKSNDY